MEGNKKAWLSYVVPMFNSPPLYFVNLRNLLHSVFLQKKLGSSLPELNKYESTILKFILNKKFFPYKDQKNIDLNSFDSIVSISLTRKKEYSIKFVIMRSLYYVKNKFFNKEMKNISAISSKKYFSKASDAYFYDYYFGDLALKKNLPIESFYAFKNWSHRYNKSIPKSITKKLIQLWKLNPEFTQNIRDYLQNQIMQDFILFNKKKINKMIDRWSKIIEKFGIDAGFNSILSSFNLRGSKLPWTVSEVKHALKVTSIVLS